MSRRLPALAAASSALVLAVTLTGCGSDSSKPPATADNDLSATPAAQVTTAPAADAKVIAIKLANGTVEPSGERVAVKANQPVVLQINAHAAGELHVHSSPEQHIEYPKGGSEITLKFAQPGVIDVESHTLDKLIVQLKVS